MGKDLKGNKLQKGIRQKSDGLYEFRFTNRFGKRDSLVNKNYSKLVEMSKVILAKDNLNISSKKVGYTVSQVFDQAIAYNAHGYEENTVESYISAFNTHVRNTRVGKAKIDSIRPLEIKDLLIHSCTGHKKSTYVTLKAVFKMIYDYAVINQYVMFNFMSSVKVKFVDNEKTRIVESLSKEEQKVFLSYIKDTNNCNANLYILMINTGLRIREALAISKNDVDFDNRILKIRHQLVYRSAGIYEETGCKFKFSKPKRNKERIVPLNDSAILALKRQLEINLKECRYPMFEGLIFRGRTGNPYNRETIKRSFLAQQLQLYEI